MGLHVAPIPLRFYIHLFSAPPCSASASAGSKQAHTRLPSTAENVLFLLLLLLFLLLP